MKPHRLEIACSAMHSFSVRRDVVPYFYNRWHYHPEVELVFFEEGYGTQFVGDSIQPFNAGDIVLLGSDLPHYWQCGDAFFADNSPLRAKAIVVHFSESFWGNSFLMLPEMNDLRQLLSKAKRGIRLSEKIKGEAGQKMQALLQADGASRLILLLQILQLIAGDAASANLATGGFRTEPQVENERMQRIYSFTQDNFRRKFSLSEVAAHAHLSPLSFSRYFKSVTRKTYSAYLQEIRIGHACKLLIENRLTITQVCYESGFNNFTNFYRLFKRLTNRTPLEYQKKYLSGCAA